MRLNITSGVLAKTGSSSLKSHIAYTQNIKKIKQLKQSAGGRGDINIARHFRRVKEGGNITFEQQSVVLWWTL